VNWRCPCCDEVSSMYRYRESDHCSACGWEGRPNEHETTIDVTPSRSSLLQPMLELLENPNTSCAIKQLIREEFTRAFKALDTLSAERRKP